MLVEEDRGGLIDLYVEYPSLSKGLGRLREFFCEMFFFVDVVKRVEVAGKMFPSLLLCVLFVRWEQSATSGRLQDTVTSRSVLALLRKALCQ